MAVATCASSLAFAQDNNASGLEVLEPFEVIGSKQNAQKLVGTGTYLDASDLSPFFHTDINEILNQVPGVYARGEEGYGLFPNVSIRGVCDGDGFCMRNLFSRVASLRRAVSLRGRGARVLHERGGAGPEGHTRGAQVHLAASNRRWLEGRREAGKGQRRGML